MNPIILSILNLIDDLKDGDIGFLSNHSNIITSIRPGILKLDDTTANEKSLFVEEGFVKFSNNELLIVAVGIDNKESINTDFINEKITKLSEELAHVEEYKKTKIQNKIDCLKLLLN